MGKYLARVALNYNFAQDRLEGLGTFWLLIRNQLPESCKAELPATRFTFCTFLLEAGSRDECRSLIESAWNAVFPNEKGISEILVTDYSGDPTSELMKVIYNSYYGVESYQRLVTELTDTIPMLAEKKALDIVRKQNYLYAVDSGCGFTMMLNSIGDYLHNMRIYPEDEFEKRTYYIEYKAAHETENGCTSPDDILSELSEAVESKKYNIVGIDISYFLDGRKHDELRRFINRLDRFQDLFVFAFRVPFLEKKSLDEIEALLSDMMLLRVIPIPPLNDAVMLEAVWNTLTARGFTPDPSIIETVRRKIQREKTDGRYYGFKTAVKLSCEIILKKTAMVSELRGSNVNSDVSIIKADDLRGFAEPEDIKATGYDALTEMIGMEKITERVREIVAQVKIAVSNDKLDHPCIHMRFTGSPGTGKTTVARIIGQILREEGVLRKGGFFEYGARDLVAEYEGQTAVKTSSVCRDAYGSVLFIDEAYALNEGKNQSANFGREALAALVSEMENHRDDMLVVMAGYTDEMEELMKVNPGLRSRMPYILDFPNYTRHQLFEIFMLMVRKHFSFDPSLEAQALEFFTNLSDEYLGSKEFPNARFARNLYERTWSKGALRCSLSGETNIVLTKEDFISASSEKEFNEKLETKKKIGFAK